MRCIAIALTLTAIAFCSASAAEPEPAMTAEDLQQLCTGEDHVSRNACRIYILGVTQGIALGLHLLGRDGHPARPCVPAGVSAEALERTVKEKLADDLTAHPQDRQREAAGFISAALAAAFPCSKQ